jgi:hypothetical protein
LSENKRDKEKKRKHCDKEKVAATRKQRDEVL